MPSLVLTVIQEIKKYMFHGKQKVEFSTQHTAGSCFRAISLPIIPGACSTTKIVALNVTASHAGCATRNSVSRHEHHRLVSLDQHRVSKVPAHSTRQYEPFQVAALANHVRHGIAVADARYVLRSVNSRAKHARAAVLIPVKSGGKQEGGQAGKFA